jgi:hypothetical protein
VQRYKDTLLPTISISIDALRDSIEGFRLGGASQTQIMEDLDDVIDDTKDGWFHVPDHPSVLDGDGVLVVEDPLSTSSQSFAIERREREV